MIFYILFVNIVSLFGYYTVGIYLNYFSVTSSYRLEILVNINIGLYSIY